MLKFSEILFFFFHFFTWFLYISFISLISWYSTYSEVGNSYKPCKIFFFDFPAKNLLLNLTKKITPALVDLLILFFGLKLALPLLLQNLLIGHKIHWGIGLLQIIFAALIVPKSQDLARSFLRASSINYLENFIKPKIFNDAVKGLTIYSNSKDENGNLKEIYLKKGSADNFQITFAKQGRFKQIGENQFLELNFGETISVINNKITNFKFKKTDFNLSNFEDNTTTYKKTQEVATLDLIKCYHNLMNFNFLKIDKNFKVENCKNDNIDNIIKELYKRIIIPLYIPVLILISLMLIFKSKENINYSKYRILIFLIGFITIILSEMTIRLINEDFIKNLKFIVIPIILVVSLYFNYLIRFKNMKVLKWIHIQNF